MDQIKNITKEIAQGLFHSISGIGVVFYLDREVNKKLNRQCDTDVVMVDLVVDKKKSILTSYRNKKRRKNKTPKKQRLEQEETKVFWKVIQCISLNGMFFLSILLFEYVLLPWLLTQLTKIFGENSNIGLIAWSWIHRFLSIFFHMIWVMPMFVLSRIVNNIWFQNIADSTFKFRKGRPQLMPWNSKLITDVLFAVVVEALFLVQSMVVRLLPIHYLGEIFCFIHLCLLYSLYSFEYKWFNMGWAARKRLSFIENNWPYFLGFGMPLAILTQLTEYKVVSGCVFACLLPFFIISGIEAIPIISSCDISLKLFSPVIAISNALFSKMVQSSAPNMIAREAPINRIVKPAGAKVSKESSYRGFTPTSHRSSLSTRSLSHRK